MPTQRKRVDPEVHPFRFLNTHARLFPDIQHFWDPERARVLRRNDVRNSQHNIITGADNGLSYHRAQFDEPATAPLNGSHKNVSLSRSTSGPVLPPSRQWASLVSDQ